MPYSIARRVHRAVFTISLICLVITVGMIYFGYEQMEQAMLGIEIQAERDFVLENIDKGSPLAWDTTEFKAFYAPGGRLGQLPLPAVFRGLPYPFSGEIELGEATFLVTISETGGGRLYVAKDITLFERREALFTGLLVAVCLGVIGISFVLARVNSRRLVMPLQQLAAHIGGTVPGRRMPRVPAQIEDAELATIATTFNGFLDELEAYVQREQSLLGLASHELRTPIAVLAGALDVMEQRGQLQAADRRTLARAQRASAEMSANVEVVLKLARRKEHVEQPAAIDLPAMTRELLTEFDPAMGAPARVAMDATTAAAALADPVLVKMLLRNLIHNALQHTTGAIRVRLAPGRVEIADHGVGLPESARRLLLGQEIPSSAIPALPGLGLLLVTLICARLGWRLELPRNAARGTTIHLVFEPPFDRLQQAPPLRPQDKSAEYLA